MVCKALRLRENTILKFLCKFLYFQYCCFFLSYEHTFQTQSSDWPDLFIQI